MAQFCNALHIARCLALQPVEERPIMIIPNSCTAQPLCEVGKPFFRTNFAAQPVRAINITFSCQHRVRLTSSTRSCGHEKRRTDEIDAEI